MMRKRKMTTVRRKPATIDLLNENITAAAAAGDKEFVKLLKAAKEKMLDTMYPDRHKEYEKLFGKYSSYSRKARRTFAGFPPTITPAGTSSITTEPAATTLPLPILAITSAPLPNQQFSPTETLVKTPP